jgi:hypothetical protein
MTEANPYESPQQSQPIIPARRFSWGKVAAGAILLILLVPATGYAFLISILIAFWLRSSESVTWYMAGGCSFATFALIVGAFALVVRSMPGPRDAIRRDRSDTP